MVIETTDHHPSWWRRFSDAALSAQGGLVGLQKTLIIAGSAAGRVGFATTLPLPPQLAHEAVKRALVVLCETQVLATYPETIATVGRGEFDGIPLAFELTSKDARRTRVEAICWSGGNRSLQEHKRRRREVRRLVEFIAEQNGAP